MLRNRVLLIDDDEVVQNLAKRTLVSVDPDADLVAVFDAETAVQQLQENHFDIIVSDLTLLEQDNDRVYRTINTTQNSGFTLIVSAYGSTDLGQHVDRLKIPHIIHKPVDITRLSSMFVEALEAKKKLRVDHFSLSELAYQKIDQGLIELRNSTNARCILVSDTYGRVLVTVGDTEGLAIDAVTSLLGGGIATLLEAGQSLDDGDVINLAYREGKKADLYAVNIGLQLLLILVIDRGLFYNRLGTVWFYTRQTVINLNKILQEAETAHPRRTMHGNLHQAYDEELNRLFKDT